MKVSIAKSVPAGTGALVLPVIEGGAPVAAFTAMDKAADGALKAAMTRAGFTGKHGKSCVILGATGIDAGQIILLGLGKADDLTLERCEEFGGAAAAALLASREKKGAIDLEGLDARTLNAGTLDAGDIAAHCAFGARLRGYRFDKYRTRPDADERPVLERCTIATPDARAGKVFATLDKIADGVFLTRDLVSEPANILYPESFAECCRTLEKLGVKVTVLGEAEMSKLGMGSLLGVGQGSVRESKLVAMEWMGGKKNQKPIAFVGKGVTFDTGGISLKPGPGMEDMKWDMGGAGAVVGAMAALAGRKAKANVVGVVGLVENMPDGNAQRPGDVVTSMSGQTIEILNTDAEGRLVLADAVWWTQETYKPETLIDLATLTGAIIIALAHEFAGVFTEVPALFDDLLAAGEASGDKVWRMPLTRAHYQMIKSDIADMKNIGGREGGSSTAAAFIGNFIKPETKWAHIDIAGMAWNKKDKPTCPKGAAGYGVRLLDTFVRQTAE